MYEKFFVPFVKKYFPSLKFLNIPIATICLHVWKKFLQDFILVVLTKFNGDNSL